MSYNAIVVIKGFGNPNIVFLITLVLKKKILDNKGYRRCVYSRNQIEFAEYLFK
ncbi:hypothetical protein METP1_01091 [Methanosarcinales archaeon]|nr:hypothetical protein METP1_01091 [Methanosarcinales archaeon]